MDGAAVFQVAAQADGQIVQPSHFPGNGQKVCQGLGGMVVHPVSGVDNGYGGIPGGHEGRAVLGVANGHDVGVAGDDFRGICHALALGGGGGVGRGEAQHAAAQLQHGGLKAQSGTGGGLIEKGCQLFVFAAVPIFFRVGRNVLGGGDELVQLLYGKVQDAVKTSHALPPLTAR